MRMFYRIIFVFVLIFNINAMAADTTIVGDVYGMWDSRYSEYNITGNINIPEDSTLRIYADSDTIRVIFHGDYRFTINRNATLIVNVSSSGDTATNEVSFESPSQETTWSGLLFDHSDSSSILYKARIRKVNNQAVYIDSTDLTLINCILEENNCGFIESGGGIYSQNSDITVRGCNFNGNIAFAAGGLFCKDGIINITGNYFYNNQAIGTNGGGALLQHVQEGIFKNNVFDFNVANEKGGGLDLSDTTTIAIENCTFFQNSARFGGAISTRTEALPTINSCILWDDMASLSNPEIYVEPGNDNPIVKYSDVNENLGYLDYSCINEYPIFNDTARVHVIDLSLSWSGIQDDVEGKSPCINTGDPLLPKDADSSYADMGAYPYHHIFNLVGRIQLDTLQELYSPYYVMSPCSVSSGDGLYIEPGVEVLFKHCYDAGVISLYDIVVCSGSYINAPGTAESIITFGRNDPGIGYKGINFVNSDPSYFTFTRFLGADSSAAITLTNSTGVLDTCYFEKNNYGAVASYNGSLICSSSVFVDNEAVRGAAVNAIGGSLDLFSNTFKADSASAEGGAISLSAITDLNLKRNVFWLNHSNSYGGAIYCDSLAPIERTLFTNNTFYRNKSENSGGAIYANAVSDFDIQNCIFWENLAIDYQSRHLYFAGNNVTYDYCDLSQGSLNDIQDADSCISDDPLFVDRDNGDFNLGLGSPCIERGNPDTTIFKDPDTTRTDIGARHFPQGMQRIFGDITGKTELFPPDTFKVTGDIIVSDGDTLIIEQGVTLNFMGMYDIIVENTGLLLSEGKWVIMDDDTTFSRVRYTSFDTSRGWGSICFNNAESSLVHLSLIEYSNDTPIRLDNAGDGVVISYNIFENNYGENTPGAVLADGSSPQVIFNLFTNNLSESNGGAVSIENGSDARIERNIFWLNEAFNYGGGVYIEGCTDSMALLSNTFYANQANTGGGVYLNNCSPLLLNSIIWNNDANYSSQIHVDSSMVAPFVDYCDIQNGYTSGGANNISDDPMFIEPSAGDFSLMWVGFPYTDSLKSPCIDMGHPNDTLYIDADGTRIDIGAVSFYNAFIHTNYFPGDINMWVGDWPPLVIGADVSYLVNYFRNKAEPCFLDSFFGPADVNGDCAVIGSDVTYLVNYFRNLNDLTYCPFHPTNWPESSDLPGEMPFNWPNCQEIEEISNSRQTEYKNR